MFQSWRLGWRSLFQTSLRRDSSRARSGYRPRMETLEDRTVPSTFLVTSVSNGGAGSLRAAISAVNKDVSGTVDEIDFNLGGGGAQTINLTSELPLITHPAFINGASQPGYAGSPLVTLNGPSTTVADGLVFLAQNYHNPFTAQALGLAFTNLGDSIKVTDTNSTTPLTALVQNNSISSTKGGDALTITTGTAHNSVTVSGNTITSTGAGDGIRLTGGGSSNSVTLSSNSVSVQQGGDALVFLTARSATTTASILGNALHSAGKGFGLNLGAGANWQVMVQGNDFTNNLRGVRVSGDGTSAGVVDLGGGALGSTGGNNFTGYTQATANSYAIGLFGVAPSYTLNAQHNLFSVDPSLVIADGTHDPAAHGKGSIVATSI